MQTYIVVGAGILGASVAYHLVKAGAKVTLIDRKDVGQATDAATGMVCPWLSQRRNKAWYQLAKSGASYYPSLIQQLETLGETETGYKQVGAISLQAEGEKLDKMIERVQRRRLDAPEIGEITRLSVTETKRAFPPLAEQYGSVYISGAARVNSKALREALVNAARKQGAAVLQGDAALLHQGKQIMGVQVEGRVYQADQVIVTAGAWANKLLAPLGVHFLVTYQKGQVIHLQLPNTRTGSWPVVLPPNDQCILAFGEGKIVVGATHEDETGLDERVTAGGMQEILDKALSIAPGLANCTILEARAGFRPFTPGFLPVIGALPNYEGLLLANGLGASGLTVGPYLGSELAKLALGKPTEIDPSKYAVAGAIEQIVGCNP